MEALSKAEFDISFASRRLEKAFKQKNEESVHEGSGHIPNPVKIVRRLKALELAMVQLRKDCEIIFKKRSDIVRSVVAKQNNNVNNVEKLLREISAGTPERYTDQRSSKEDPNWNDLKTDLSKQCSLFETDGM